MSLSVRQILVAVVAAAIAASPNTGCAEALSWSDTEIAILRSLAIDNLPPLPADPTNSVADDPRAAEFGQQLFFDARLSATGSVSCSTCHQAERHFTDGLDKGQGIGQSKRNTPSIVGVAYSPWLYWDGRRDSLWSQALSPLEDPVEHGGNRQQYAHFIETTAEYLERYETLFGAWPDLSDPASVDLVFANLGKAIAAYERLLMPGRSRFDDYVDAVVANDAAAKQELFNPDEEHGLQLFIGEANCTQCHNGPLFTNNEFHNTGVLSYPGEVPDRGRIAGVREVLSTQFNCRSEFNDAQFKECAELEFARSGYEVMGAFRTPSLRNLAGTAPFMHKGQLKSLADVLQHYNDAPDAMIGHNEAKALNLDDRELQQIEAFLNTLTAPLSTDSKWLVAPVVPAIQAAEE